MKPSICHWEEDKNSLEKKRSRLLGPCQASSPALRSRGRREAAVAPSCMCPGALLLPSHFYDENHINCSFVDGGNQTAESSRL